MNLVFFIGRNNFYKFLASLIDEGIKRGHTIECWHDYTQPRVGMKDYLFPRIEDSPFFNCGNPNLKLKKLENEGDFEKHLDEKRKNNYVDYFVGLSPADTNLNKSTLKYISGKWCIIMHGFDIFFEYKNLSHEINFNYNRYFFVFSNKFFKYGFDWINKYYPKQSINFRSEHTKVVPIGCTMIGSRNELKSMNTKLIRKKYGINEDQKIVVYLPYPVKVKETMNEQSKAFRLAYAGIYCNMIKSNMKLNNNMKLMVGFKNNILNVLDRIKSIIKILKHHESRRYLIKRYNEPRVFKAVKTFCNNNNLLLIVKPRIKYQITDYVRNNADLCIFDDEKQQYPTILQELFSIADLTIGNFSVAVFESVSYGVPYLNIEGSKLQFLDIAHSSLFSNYDDSVFNYRSVAYNWNVTKIISEFKNMSIDDFSMKNEDRESYMEKFLGPINGTSANRFYDYLENKFNIKDDIDIKFNN